MNKDLSIQVVKKYLELSNEAKLDRIREILDENLIYLSSAVGEFQGRQEVMQMMQDFFKRFERPQWSWEELEYIESEGCVAFNFTMRSPALEGERRGLEKIWVNDLGKITKVSVEV